MLFLICIVAHQLGLLLLVALLSSLLSRRQLVKGERVLGGLLRAFDLS